VDVVTQTTDVEDDISVRDTASQLDRVPAATTQLSLEQVTIDVKKRFLCFLFLSLFYVFNVFIFFLRFLFFYL